jgi:hypothetical protein
MNLIRIALPMVLTLTASLFAADKSGKFEDKDLTAKATSARTADDHREIARDYEARAREFEAKAKAYEAEAARLSRLTQGQPLQSKWPAMAQGPANHQRGKAIQARRAARESLEMVARHQDLAEKASTIAVE